MGLSQGWDLIFENQVEKLTNSFGYGLVFRSNLFDVKVDLLV